MREHVGSGGLYAWGITKTAEYFGIGNRQTCRKLYDELAAANKIEITQEGKDPKTGRGLTLIVRPWGKNPTESKHEPKPCSNSEHGQPESSKIEAVSPLDRSMCISDHHTVKGIPTVDRPVSIDPCSYKTVVGCSENEHGLRKALKDERDILALWGSGKSAKSREKADQCRRKIADLESRLAGAQ
jgi:hypothetical protein